MENRSAPISVSKRRNTLPGLEDPKHPGMFLISRIGLFSLALFAILIGIGAYLTATVSLDIELPLNGITKPNNEFVLYAEPSKAVLIEPGQRAKVTLANGNTLEAEVIEVQPAITSEVESIPIVLQSTGTLSASVIQYLQANNGAAISVTVFTQHSLWTFLKEKVEY